MQTLYDLNNNNLQGIKRLTLSENLTIFPEKIFDLAESLEILDLSNNRLSDLPDLSRLKKLKIAFFSNNNFKKVPNAFKKCSELYMLGFKANQIELLDEDILPSTISWLILTDNKITTLPSTLGNLTKLRKCALAGNQIASLPASMQKCRELELIRLSANALEEIPSWLLKLPKLSWLAFSGNRCSIKNSVDIRKASLESLELQELLGEGASGMIYKAYSKELQKDVALKMFKGAVTSDGYAEDEMQAYMSIGSHDNFIEVLSKIDEDGKLGLKLELISDEYTNLGMAPNFETCTRDTFERSYSLQIIESVIKDILSALVHLHAKNIMHGDLYAHNILIHPKSNHAFLTDFGAATFYNGNEEYEKIEVRAFGCLIEDLLSTCSEKSEYLEKLQKLCMQEDVEQRPLFCQIEL